MHYDAVDRRQYPLTAILRASILSVRSPQVRYVVRGDRGTYTKYGIDVQEEQLKVISSPNAILKEEFGMEPEYLWGSVEKMEADDQTVTKMRYASMPLMEEIE